MRTKASKGFIGLPMGIGIVAALVMIYPWLLFKPMGWLIYRNDHPKPNADLILVLMGEPEIRPQAGAVAVKNHIAPRLMMITSQLSPLEEAGFIPSEDKIAMESIRRTGLPLNQVQIVSDFGRATSTMDEALAFRDWLRAGGSDIKRLVIVTSWPHTSRAGWTFEKILAGTGITVELLPVEEIPFSSDNWWHSERGMLFVFEEYIKYGRYLAKYLGRAS
jgi:uncharacterized SAM-binding protein YcdF (DUF218 family)